MQLNLFSGIETNTLKTKELFFIVPANQNKYGLQKEKVLIVGE